jgi:pimeloyl-ACP methyl ester carboxylesterase
MTTATFQTQDGCRLAFVDDGQGLPVLWQHGLGADSDQPAEVFPPMSGIRRLTLECRGHGRSDLGDESLISIAQFTEDAVALLNHLGIDRAIIGGISLGAAIALRFAVMHSGRALGLILARPAWAAEDSPASLNLYQEVADVLATYGPREGRARFEASRRLAEVEAVSPDNAASLLGFFDRPNPHSTMTLLSRIPADGPGISPDYLRMLRLPTLVIANDQDYVHPLATAERLTALIPGAVKRKITSKTVDRTRYVAEFKQTLSHFLASQMSTR